MNDGSKKPVKVILSVVLTKGTPFNQIKEYVYNAMSNYFGIKVKTLHFKFKCCDTEENFSIDSIPLEDYVCQCGKTKLFEYIWID